jgi:hypothetical protein
MKRESSPGSSADTDEPARLSRSFAEAHRYMYDCAAVNG